LLFYYTIWTYTLRRWQQINLCWWPGNHGKYWGKCTENYAQSKTHT